MGTGTPACGDPLFSWQDAGKVASGDWYSGKQRPLQLPDPFMRMLLEGFKGGKAKEIT